jgi:PAS domain S-box-containing protein
MNTSLRVLLVEDSLEDALLLLHTLRRSGYDVMWERVEHAAAMSDALDQETWDVVICSNAIPEFGAPAALSLLRQRGLDLPFIIVAATITDELAVAALKEGVHDYIIKGNLARLIPSIERELREAAVRRERKQSEEALRQAEEKYRSIFENAVEGIFQSTPDGQYLSANPALARIYGYETPEELISSLTSVDGQLYVDLGQRAEFEALMQEQGTVSGFEAQVYRKDGSIIWISEHARAVRDGSGELLYYEGTVQDITNRKKLEEQLRQSQKMDAIGRLAGGIAHDFNNMLAIIIGYSQLLLDRCPQDNPMRRYLEEISNAGDRAAGLTRQLLTFSRKQVLAPRVLDLNDVVASTEKMLRRLIGEDVELVTISDSSLGQVKADPGQLEQVILNLAVNARDAMPQGGRLTIETRNVELRETYTRHQAGLQPGAYVLLAVRDTGCGMDAELQSHVFEPFFTTKEQGQGTGLGLAMVYGIVQQSGGHIAVCSEPGRGATFKIYLPRIEEAEPAFVPPAAPAATLPGWETVLLVEDEPLVRGLVRQLLQESGYTVLEASQGEDALRICRQAEGPIHLLITDVVMPGMSGRELAERMAPLRPETKVLFMSGYTDDAIVRHGVLAAEAAFLQKPFTPAGLTRKVREVLGAGGATGGEPPSGRSAGEKSWGWSNKEEQAVWTN